jgi:hypothetical protein
MLTRAGAILVCCAVLFPLAAVGQTTLSPPRPPAPAAPPVPAATPAPADARLYFIAPSHGARVRGPVTVQFGLRNMGVTQAGSTAPNAGHHHILVDAKGALDLNEPIPADRSHIHFGAGQTETELDLAPGRHTLQLVLGDANHRPFQPVVLSEKIEITVLDPEAAPTRQKRRRAKRAPRHRHY